MEYWCLTLILHSLAIFTVSKATNFSGNYDGFKVLRLTPSSQDQLQCLIDLQTSDNDLSFWSLSRRQGEQTDILVPSGRVQDVTDHLTASGFLVTTFVEDVGSLIEEERNRILYSNAQSTGFNYDEYNTYENIMVEMEVMAAACPVAKGILCETYVIGQSVEGRDLKVLRIYQDKPDRKVFWVDSLIHAREWMAGATALKVAHHLITEYDNDMRAQFFLNEGDWHFLFVGNPDGYIYTWDTDGDRLWRKNRSINEGSMCRGVDLNRNFAFKWSTVGTSTNPCVATYHGSGPASEPETQAVQAEISRLSSSMATMTSIHSYGNYWLMPFGSEVEGQCEHMPEPDDTMSNNVINAMADDTERVYNTQWKRGNVCETIYAAAGSSMDYARGVAGIMYGFSPETRGRYGGFITPASEIQLSFEEILVGLTTMVDRVSPQCALINC